MTSNKKAHVAGYKKNIVEEFVNLINEYPIIGAVNMENMPAPQLQKMRALLRDTVVIQMTKRRLIKIAIDKAKDKKKDLEKLSGHLIGMPALLFTKENPFRLYRTIQQNKSKAPAKGGQTAPNDIIVQAGPTSFAPGPVIGELGSIGLKTGVENGKITIKQDYVVVKQGQVIPQKTAELLTRLGIEPMEIGLDLVATYEGGAIFTKDILSIDEAEFNNKIQNAARWAFNLSVEASYPTKDNIEVLVGKGFRESKALALEQNIMCDAVAEELIAKAERSMLNLKNIANIEAVARPKSEEKKEQPKVEEKKEEVKQEQSGAEVEEPVPEETLKQQMHDDAQKLQEELKKDEEKVNKIIRDAPEPDKKEIKKEAEEIKKLAENIIKEEQNIEKKEKEIEDSERLFEQLKKKGTLRDVNIETKTGLKKKKSAGAGSKEGKVPTAHELAEKLKQKK